MIPFIRFTKIAKNENCYSRKGSSALFASSMGGLKQNVNSILTHVPDTVFHALSHGSLHFVLHGSLVNRLFQRILLAVEENQPIKKWLKKLPWRAKPRLPCERA